MHTKLVCNESYLLLLLALMQPFVQLLMLLFSLLLLLFSLLLLSLSRRFVLVAIAFLATKLKSLTHRHYEHCSLSSNI